MSYPQSTPDSTLLQGDMLCLTRLHHLCGQHSDYVPWKNI